MWMLRLLLVTLLALATTVVIPCCDAFTFRINDPPRINGKPFYHTPSNFFKATSSDGDTGVVNTITTTFETTLAVDGGTLPSSRLARLRRKFRKSANTPKSRLHRFAYDYDEMVIGKASNSSTTAVVLIHPIGVGIGKWFHDRLLRSLAETYGGVDRRIVFLSPDLLGSATASGPVDENGDRTRRVPLLNVTDWTDQVTRLMAEYEARSEGEGHRVGGWSVVANGGCSPVALGAASASLRETPPFRAALTNVVLSSPPRLPFFLGGADPARVRKSYRTLSGIPGRLFWWYSLRREGRFVQKFSERNLVGDAASLGEEWTPNCVAAARLFGGRSRYSTFAFLAGALQDGCSESLDALRGSDVMIDFIRGTDGRRNRAKSWFWKRKKNNVKKDVSSSEGGTGEDFGTSTEETIQQYVEKNGNRGKELFVGGRISLAWEDSDGYAKSLMELLHD